MPLFGQGDAWLPLVALDPTFNFGAGEARAVAARIKLSPAR